MSSRTTTKFPRRSDRLKQKSENALQVKTRQTEVQQDRSFEQTSGQPTVLPVVIPDTSEQTTIQVERTQEIELKPCKTISVKTKNSQASRIRIVEIQHAIKKKQLEEEEIRKKQELLDLELALQLEEIGSEEVESDESESRYSSVNVENWIGGKNPWQDKYDVPSQLNKKRSAVKEPIYFNSEVASSSKGPNELTNSQIINFLTRQSLPKELPTFDGNPIDWPNFINQFRNSTALCGYTNEENQFRLQQCLKGNAKKVVESLLIMPQNVEKAIKLLESRFGRPDQIIYLLLDKIKRFPPIKQEKLEMFIEFSDEIKNLVATLESLQEEDHLRNPILVADILNKLPTSYKLSWVEHFSKITNPQSKLIELTQWLDRKANNMSQINFSIFTDRSENKEKLNLGNAKKTVTMTAKEKNLKCICCNVGNHHISICDKFKSFSVDERWSFVTAKKLCFSCLSSSHNIKICRKRKTCEIDGCSKPHNKLLHKYLLPISNQSQTPDNSVPVTGTNFHISTNKAVFLKIIPVFISCCDKKVQTYALLDDGSSVSLIDQDLADNLGLSGPTQSLCLQWTSEDIVHHQNDSRVVSFTISGTNSNSSFQLRHVRTTKLSLPSQTIDVDNLRERFPYINGKISPLTNAQPQLIIGQDNWPLLVNRQLISGPWNGPAISKTLLGWVFHGNLVENSPKDIEKHTLCCIQSTIDYRSRDSLDNLHHLVKEQWKLEYIPSKKEEGSSPEDRRAQKILDNTMKRVGNRYETGLLWKSENIVMPESRSNALRRLYCTERKMDKNNTYAQIYCQKFEEFVNEGYVRRLPKHEVDVTSKLTWYLPHFGVVNPKKPGKLRIVFDASAISNNVSLNDCLLTGPDLYNSLQDILLNFRIKKYAFTADIKSMFLQVQVRKEDRQAQRLLWRGMDREREPDVYEICVVFFGSTSGPCLAQEAKNRNAKDFEKNFPKATHDIINYHYMDDYLGGSDTKEEAIQLIQDIIFVHKQGGFTICNWIVNDQDILNTINPELTAPISKKIVDTACNDEEATERILGVFWSPKEDIFKFETKFDKISLDIFEYKRRPTKREVLKIVMSVFDPLGFLAHVLIRGKVLLQDIWRSKIGWDDEITEKMNEKWVEWMKDLKVLREFKVPRQYFILDRHKSDIQLHVFVDASETCYAAVASLRTQHEHDVEVTFVSARARVAPLKLVSIPRLELQAALLGSRLGHALKQSLNLKISTCFYWSDSKTVLHWIRSEARRFKMFIAHRLGECL